MNDNLYFSAKKAVDYLAVPCADEDIIDNSHKDEGVSVAFRVNNVQDEMLLQQTDVLITRAAFDARLRAQGLTAEDLEIRKLRAESLAGIDACLIETTVEGVNPEKPSPETRAKTKRAAPPSISGGTP